MIGVTALLDTTATGASRRLAWETTVATIRMRRPVLTRSAPRPSADNGTSPASRPTKRLAPAVIHSPQGQPFVIVLSGAHQTHASRLPACRNAIIAYLSAVSRPPRINKIIARSF